MDFKFVKRVQDGDVYVVVSDDPSVDGSVGLMPQGDVPWCWEDSVWFSPYSATAQGWLAG